MEAITEPLTTYTVTGNDTNIVWQFKYDLNGLLKEFKLVEGNLDNKQVGWLFNKDRFPYAEKTIKGWTAISNFKVIVGEPDVSFEIFWRMYNHKVKRMMSENAWKKMSQKDRMDAIRGIKPYDGMLYRKGFAKAAPSSYLNQRYWEDEHSSIH